MKDTLLIIKPDGQRIERALSGAPDLQTLKDSIGGGWIEAVPGFDNIEIDDAWHRCAVFCDEEGKLKDFEMNRIATLMWHAALKHSGHPGLIAPDGGVADVLCGDIAILFGTDQMLDNL